MSLEGLLVGLFFAVMILAIVYAVTRDEYFNPRIPPPPPKPRIRREHIPYRAKPTIYAGRDHVDY